MHDDPTRTSGYRTDVVGDEGTMPSCACCKARAREDIATSIFVCHDSKSHIDPDTNRVFPDRARGQSINLDSAPTASKLTAQNIVSNGTHKGRGILLNRMFPFTNIVYLVRDTMALTQEPNVKSFETRLFINGKVKLAVRVIVRCILTIGQVRCII